MECYSLQELVLVFVGVTVEHRLYQRKVDVDMLSAVENILADVSSVKLSSEQYLKRQLQLHSLRRSA